MRKIERFRFVRKLDVACPKPALSAVFIFMSTSLFVAFAASAEESPVAKCGAYLYKPKKEEVPVYSEAEMHSAVVGRAKFDNRFCVVGSDKDFLIVDRTSSIINFVEGYEPKSDQKLVYVRRFDFWKIGQSHTEASENSANQSPFISLVRQAKKYFFYMQQGGVPEDPLAPYRDMKDSYTPEEAADCDEESCK